MSEQTVPLDELMKELPPEHQRELREFAEFLLARHRGRRRGKPRFEWAGALSDLQGRYNSVELQHQISRWRIEGE